MSKIHFKSLFSFKKKIFWRTSGEKNRKGTVLVHERSVKRNSKNQHLDLSAEHRFHLYTFTLFSDANDEIHRKSSTDLFSSRWLGAFFAIIHFLDLGESHTISWNSEWNLLKFDSCPIYSVLSSLYLDEFLTEALWIRVHLYGRKLFYLGVLINLVLLFLFCKLNLLTFFIKTLSWYNSPKKYVSTKNCSIVLTALLFTLKISKQREKPGNQLLAKKEAVGKT